MTAFGDFQLEIYLAGLQGVLPSFPMAFAELEARAERALPPSVLSYVAGGAGSEHTQRANVSAFAQWGLIPRMFVGASQRDLSVELFGMRLPSPLLMAPIGVIGLCAQDGHGDLATAEAAERTGVPMIASTLSADPMEDVAPRFGDTPGTAAWTGSTAPPTAAARPTAACLPSTACPPWSTPPTACRCCSTPASVPAPT